MNDDWTCELECEWCFHACKGWQELADHLIYYHLNEHGLSLTRNHTRVWCYCGSHYSKLFVSRSFWSDREMSQFASHLKKVGGLAAHLLKIAFEIEGTKAKPEPTVTLSAPIPGWARLFSKIKRK